MECAVVGEFGCCAVEKATIVAYLDRYGQIGAVERGGDRNCNVVIAHEGIGSAGRVGLVPGTAGVDVEAGRVVYPRWCF